MKYYIRRGVNEYGPYTLADLQRYVAQGNIAMTDLTRSEGMTDWVPVSQVIGNIPVPVSPPAGGPAYPGAPGTVYGATPGYGAAGTVTGPVPPDFPWGLVLLITIFTCLLFGWAWLIVEAAWIRKIKPASRGLLFALLALASWLVGAFISGIAETMEHTDVSYVGGLFPLASIVLYFVAVFTMRSDLEEYYNSTENINLRLSGVMTFFFAIFYFQHQFSRIARWKKTGVLEPQQ
jgi:hypothetical protein